MNRSILIAAAIAAATAGVALAAPPDTASGASSHRAKLDANHDGVIDRAEAAAHPRLAAKFDTLDKNRDGRLDASERPERKGRGGHRGHGGGMEHVLRLDANGDGRISKAEAASQARFAERFDQADRNRDGYLVRSELQAAHESRRAEFAAKHRQRMDAKFTEADRNRDGKLSRTEVETSLPHVAKAFAFYDENRDGYLTRGDLEHKPRR